MRENSKVKAWKTGDSTRYKRQEIPMGGKSMKVQKRTELHSARHPNDKNKPKKERGVNFGKKTQRDKDLDNFYKTHVYTWVSTNRRSWVAIPVEEEE